MVQSVKNLPAIQVPSLYCIVHPKGQEDPLKKGMASHSSTLAWEIPRTEEPEGLQSIGSQSQDATEQLDSDLNPASRKTIGHCKL